MFIIPFSKSATASENSNNADVHWQDYNGKRLGIIVGPLMEDAAAKYFPDRGQTPLYGGKSLDE